MTLSKRDNPCLSAAGLASGITPAKVKTTNATSYNINGRTFNKAATDDFWTLAGAVMAAGQVQVIWLYINAAGTASVEASALKSASTSTSLTDRYVPGAFDWPDPIDKSVVGAVVITATGPFTPGTTSTATQCVFVNAGPDYGTPITY